MSDGDSDHGSVPHGPGVPGLMGPGGGQCVQWQGKHLQHPRV